MPLNLAVSLITIVTSLIIRGVANLDLSALSTLALPAAAMMGGAVVTAFIGPSLASRLSDARLERIILVLLVAIGIALIVEAFIPQT